MVAAIGIGLPQLALFHICTHAFFKALLFLCSGSLIHSFKNEQDLRKISTRTYAAPLTTRILSIARLALCGVPFLAGFYSKDLILEAAQVRVTKRVGIILAMAATLMTAFYRFRVVYFIGNYPPNKAARVPTSEENPNLTQPLLRLLIGAILAG